MTVGVPKEVKNNENRVAMVPDGIYEIVKMGCKVIVEASAGIGSGITDDDYAEAGAVLYTDKKALFDESDVIMKVKEPLPEEYGYFHEGQILFTYLHLAADKEQAEFLRDKKITAFAYETVQTADGSLPLLSPMSEVAGRMSIQIGAAFLQKNNGGKGIVLAGVPGVAPAEVVVLGGGTVGFNAAKTASWIGARVTILDISRKRLIYLDDIFGGKVTTLMSTAYNIAAAVKKADLLIGAVLVPGGKAPCLVTEEMVKTMSPGSVIVDVAIDQGGSIETIDRVTTHENPCYEKHGVIHYSVANMPGAVPKTSTYALTGSTIQYLKRIISKGVDDIIASDKELLSGLNVYKGNITHRGVADALELEYVDALSLI
ncbi:MAG: alanine dehydrogenase [Oscillospiraceae bacterium]|nr:alanine dehydrogenase [Oscillospiraceae bacterium]